LQVTKGGPVKVKTFGTEVIKFEEAANAWLEENEGLGEIKHISIALSMDSQWMITAVFYEAK
jgi:hypothetical protein